NDGWRELRRDDDPARGNVDSFDRYYVRYEQVYLRPVTSPAVPYGLLGKPPLSVWVPAGDYEIIVVHDAPAPHSYVDTRPRWFPLMTVFDACSVSANAKTVRVIRLPHYDWGGGEPIVP